MMNRLGLSIVTIALASVFLLAMAAPRANPASGLALDQAAALPVVDGGRVKPLDTVARTSLMIISGRQYCTDTKGKTLSAMQWLLEVLAYGADNSPADEYRIFRIENDQLLSELGLKARPGSFRYSRSELQENEGKLDQLGRSIEAKAEKDRTVFDEAVVKLIQHLQLYLELANHRRPLIVPEAEMRDWHPLADYEPEQIARQRTMSWIREHEKRLKALPAEQKKMLPEMFREMNNKHLQEARANTVQPPAAMAFLGMLTAYRAHQEPDGNAVEAARMFNLSIQTYRELVAPIADVDFTKAGLETFYNHFAPFYQCAILYVVVGLLVFASWFVHGINEQWAKNTLQAAFHLATLTLIVHAAFISVRMYLHGRPPITNLYATAIYIGWTGVTVGLILERYAPLGLGSLVAAIIGFGSMVIAHHLGTSGDTLEMMQAVLDTNFWLATHVVIINKGYAATFVAGVLGWCFVVGGMFTNSFSAERTKTVGHLIYGSVCFATLLSLVGTILGGIWADQSWGRFWGWDPKENGALVIVLWNALILHARWGGMVKERGLAVLALFGNVVTAASWFGTNLLGVGLHTYGFDATTFYLMMGIMLPSFAAMVLGLAPASWWSSPAAVGLPVTLAEAPPTPTVRGPIAKALRQKATNSAS